MALEIDQYRNELSDLCAIYGVRCLEMFGSAARGDFDRSQSDVDFLVDFTEAHSLGAFDRYFGLKEALEQLFQRSVDLVEEKAVKNPYFKLAVERDRVLVYGARSENVAV